MVVVVTMMMTMTIILAVAGERWGKVGSNQQRLESSVFVYILVFLLCFCTVKYASSKTKIEDEIVSANHSSTTLG